MHIVFQPWVKEQATIVTDSIGEVRLSDDFYGSGVRQYTF